MAPQADGSSTMGVKKSTVDTRARSGDSKKTAASSLVAASTRTRGSSTLGRRRRTCARSAEPSLQAQPAPCERAVKRMRGFWSIGASLMALPPSSSLSFLLGPDQRAQRDQGPLLLRSRTEGAVDSLPRQQWGNGSANGCSRGDSAQRKERFEGVEQIRGGPGAVGGLVRRDQRG